ncbi:MAG: PaaI family thioesterase [Flavobacteriales bacterium]|nr:PaaI family thioesterase [Flavobacteriales bacterium]MCB9187509.1 PaaI family thioesterase [Flavobacteriales bacterium]MCB9190666.1 PaaI family thioesterase [Flavobacteriales bacterium]
MMSTTFNPQFPDYKSKVEQSFASQKFMEHIGAELIDVQPGYCEIHVPFNDNLTQQNGFFHAGVIGTIADNTAGYASLSLMKEHSSVLSVEFKLNLMRPADGELLIGKGYVLKYGRTLTVCRADVFIVKDGIEKLCAAAQLTMIELEHK